MLVFATAEHYDTLTRTRVRGGLTYFSQIRAKEGSKLSRAIQAFWGRRDTDPVFTFVFNIPNARSESRRRILGRGLFDRLSSAAHRVYDSIPLEFELQKKNIELQQGRYKAHALVIKAKLTEPSPHLLVYADVTILLDATQAPLRFVLNGDYQNYNESQTNPTLVWHVSGVAAGMWGAPFGLKNVKLGNVIVKAGKLGIGSDGTQLLDWSLGATAQVTFGSKSYWANAFLSHDASSKSSFEASFDTTKGSLIREMLVQVSGSSNKAAIASVGDVKARQFIFAAGTTAFNSSILSGKFFKAGSTLLADSSFDGASGKIAESVRALGVAIERNVLQVRLHFKGERSSLEGFQSQILGDVNVFGTNVTLGQSSNILLKALHINVCTGTGNQPVDDLDLLLNATAVIKIRGSTPLILQLNSRYAGSTWRLTGYAYQWSPPLAPWMEIVRIL